MRLLLVACILLTPLLVLLSELMFDTLHGRHPLALPSAGTSVSTAAAGPGSTGALPEAWR